MSLSRYRFLLILPLLLLYVMNLGTAGFLGPDEPRYASIGREMARSGDFVTPRLDGKPWFEKPPLTYWLTALGNRVGLSDEWAARLPQALLSVAFLIFFYSVLSREFSRQMALAATSILATSIGWLAYSFAALTDLPMSAALFSAMLLTIFPGPAPSRWYTTGAGVLLGIAILGKGLVPVVLFAPVWLTARGKRMQIVIGALVAAAPWYALCFLQNGRVFWDDFFWKQHIARFFTNDLEHVQPFWYYIPVMLAGLFPWTPLLGLLRRREVFGDKRLLWAGSWVLFGFLFFSAARNKLPGYLLPLFPGIAILLGAAVAKSWEIAPKRLVPWLVICALLLVLVPTAAGVLPVALRSGLSRSNLQFSWGGMSMLVVAAVVLWLTSSNKSVIAFYLTVFTTMCALMILKPGMLRTLDETVSVRAFFLRQPLAQVACLDRVPRAWEYGLNYYLAQPTEPCAAPSKIYRQSVAVRDEGLVLQPLAP